jgi:hypothetical protein
MVRESSPQCLNRHLAVSNKRMQVMIVYVFLFQDLRYLLVIASSTLTERHQLLGANPESGLVSMEMR